MNWTLEDITKIIGELYMKVLELQKTINEQNKMINDFINKDSKEKNAKDS